jgi:hypothetical protein
MKCVTWNDIWMARYLREPVEHYNPPPFDEILREVLVASPEKATAQEMKQLFEDLRLARNRHKDSKHLCPKCGSQGRWVRAALVCEKHGVWAGI